MRSLIFLATAWLLFIAAVYVPDIGRGFVRDDFAWIDAGRTALVEPRRTLLPDTPGFYRPLVSFSFALDYTLHGLAPRGYGFSNLALFLGCVAALWALCRSLRLSPLGASIAALAWSVNPHGINMAVLWLSGRTALCVTLFAILTATTIVGRRYVWASAFMCAALASKEEALALPLILFAWHEFLVPDTERTRQSRGAVAAALFLPVIAYFVVRQQTGAFTPASAPVFYQFIFAPTAVVANALEYLDRGATISAVLIGLAALTHWTAPRPSSDRVRVILAGVAWFVGGYAITVFLPVRSSLYAVFPSVGAAIACGALVESIRTRARIEQRRVVPLEPVIALSLLLALPIYRARNDRWVEPARLSHRALHIIKIDAGTYPGNGAIVLHDESDPASSFAGAFGTLATEAVRLYTDRDLRVWIDPPPAGWQFAGLTPPPSESVLAHFALDRGRVFRRDQ